LPGGGLDLTVRLASWLRLGVGGRIHYMYFSGDDNVSLALFDGGLVLTAVLR